MSGIETRLESSPDSGAGHPQLGDNECLGAVYNRQTSQGAFVSNATIIRPRTSSLSRRNSVVEPDGSLQQTSAVWMSPHAIEESQLASPSPLREVRQLIISNPPSTAGNTSGVSIHRTDTQLQDAPGVVTPQRTSDTPESFADMSIG